MTRVGGAELHWTEAGSGPPLVLIHGLAAQLQNYIYALQDRLSRDVRVISVDRSGSGYSVRSAEEPRTLAAQARATAGLLEAERIGTATRVGYSLDGAVALSLSLGHPERVRALELLAPLTRSVGEASGIFRLLSIRSVILREVLAQTVAAPIARLRNETTVTQVFAPEPVVPDFVRRTGGGLGARLAGFRAPSEDVVAAGERCPNSCGATASSGFRSACTSDRRTGCSIRRSTQSASFTRFRAPSSNSCPAPVTCCR